MWAVAMETRQRASRAISDLYWVGFASCSHLKEVQCVFVNKLPESTLTRGL